MSVCGNCGHEGTRIRVIFPEDGGQRDECPHCNAGAFEKFAAPSDKKIWMGYEAHPNEYVKNADGGFDRKPEYRAEQEEKLTQSTGDEQEAQRLAEAKKRATRRTQPIDSVELAAAMRRAEEVASFIQVAAAEGRDVN